MRNKKKTEKDRHQPPVLKQGERGGGSRKGKKGEKEATVLKKNDNTP